MIDRELLPDHAADGEPDEMDAVDRERVEEGDGIVREIAHRGLRAEIGETVAAHIESQDAERGPDARRHGIPHVDARPERISERHDRGARGTGEIVIHGCVMNAKERHACVLPLRLPSPSQGRQPDAEGTRVDFGVRDALMDLRVVGTVAVGAAIGGVIRLLVTQFVATRLGASGAVYATFGINVTGSFLIGVVLEYAQIRTGSNPLWRYFLATGILGGYTTFSTFSFEALALFATPAAWTGLAYIVASVALGILAAAAGIALARALT